MTTPSILVALVQDESQPCAARARAAQELACVDDNDVADRLLAIASEMILPPEVATAAGASLGAMFFRLGRHMDMFPLRDLQDEAFVAFDDTVAELLLA